MKGGALMEPIAKFRRPHLHRFPFRIRERLAAVGAAVHYVTQFACLFVRVRTPDDLVVVHPIIQKHLHVACCRSAHCLNVKASLRSAVLQDVNLIGVHLFMI